MDIHRNLFLAQFQYNLSHDISIQCLVYLSVAALKWTVFICSSVSMGHTSYHLYMEAVVSSHFRYICPLCGTVLQKKKKSLHCINLQCNKYFLGNESGENELTGIPGKTKKYRAVIPLCKFICACHPTYTYSTQKICTGCTKMCGMNMNINYLFIRPSGTME
jgi:hypothetical protein